ESIIVNSTGVRVELIQPVASFTVSAKYVLLPIVFQVGAPTGVPPVLVSYQTMLSSETGVMASLALSVCIGSAVHSIISPEETGAVGNSCTVTTIGILSPIHCRDTPSAT